VYCGSAALLNRRRVAAKGDQGKGVLRHVGGKDHGHAIGVEGQNAGSNRDGGLKVSPKEPGNLNQGNNE